MNSEINFEQLFSFENLLNAWQRFRRGKTGKPQVISFERRLEDELFSLSDEILSGVYRHGVYRQFKVFDAKERDIYAAAIRDRVVHQVLHDFLEEIYEPIFIRDSFSSRKGKGVEAAVDKARFFLLDEARWNRGRCFALKCDIRKYFESVNHRILLGIIESRVSDKRIFSLIAEVIGSYSAALCRGIPLGNITSQIFANIYLHEFDCFVKKTLHVPKYLRYNDDSLFVSTDTNFLSQIAESAANFVSQRLGLQIPPNKISIRKFSWGVHFLGRIILPGAVLLRKRTIGLAFQGVLEDNKVSYLGLLRSADSFALRRRLLARLDCGEIQF